ncbi:MAG: 50S ribosomal protein L17 [bacterium]
MRHQCKRHKLGRPQDQRKALLRSLATSLFIHDEIRTTMAKAKALKPYIEHIITLAKKGDLHSRRQALKFIYDNSIKGFICSECGKSSGIDTPTKEDKCECGGKLVAKTVLRKIFSIIAPNYSTRNGGYTKIFRMPPRRGDASEMALIQLV